MPVWIFLEWLPQVLSLLDAPGHGGAAVVQTVQAIASKYPSAVYCDYKISRSEFSEIGASRCINSNLDTALTSRAGEQFARAVTLLDCVEATLVRHALLALAGGAGAKARHLVPRVLATLRETAEVRAFPNPHIPPP